MAMTTDHAAIRKWAEEQTDETSPGLADGSFNETAMAEA